MLNLLIIYYFTPYHILISYGIDKITKIITDQTKTDYIHYFSLIPYFLQILSLLFYLEIFEFNFCGLNINKKKNIILRQKDDLLKKKTTSTDIEVDEDILVKEAKSESRNEDYSLFEDIEENDKEDSKVNENQLELKRTV